MAVKTITITESAYKVLKSLKAPRESFSETIMRVAKRRPLKEFFGVLDRESGKRIESTLIEMRKRRNIAHKKRIGRIVKQFHGV
ncbi:MAG: antitoxin VapB family protein [Candidatus Aenigmarchaeota archaeon]|nr:antitoxin VapB family protein [Candidatus Aenigmarchaeota archaeon]